MIPSGFLLIDKPSGITSNDVVKKVQSLDKSFISVGHTGTLDPMATGLLVVAINEATKFIPFIDNSKKSYQTTMKFGLKSKTLDTDSYCEFKHFNPPSFAIFSETVSALIGTPTLPIPCYSACKFQGKPLYHYARKDIEIHLPQRPSDIHQIDITSFNSIEAQLSIVCGHGTYIRAIIDSIAEALNINAVMSQLHRSSIGSLTPNISFENLDKNYISSIQSIDKIIQLPIINQITPQQKSQLYHGRSIFYPSNDNGQYMIFCDQNLIGIGELSNHSLKFIKQYRPNNPN